MNLAISERAPRTDWQQMPDGEHFVQFYETETFLVDALSDFLRAALDAGDAAIVVATPFHREMLERRLQLTGLDVAAATVGGQFVALDAAETLEQLMVDGLPHVARFAEVIGDTVARAAVGRRHVRAFGEMVALLAIDGNHAAAIQLERLWNDLQRTRSFSLFCAYPMDRLGDEALGAMVEDVCVEHSRVIPAESYAALPTADERLRAITVLQQKARWLEAEIEQRKLAEERLRLALEAERTAREQAEAATRQRDEFLSIAAHELKTPLTTLSVQAQYVLRRRAQGQQLDPERLAHALQAITGQTNKLTRLINQLLDISRLKTGKMTLERQPTDLVALTEQLASDAATWSDRHVITVEAPSVLEASVDPLRLEQVLANLMDNAIKYSPDGGPIEVALTLIDGCSVEISVRDRGLGIPPDERGQIFERFYHAHVHDHRSGMGLGLYVTRQIVELHGGDIRAEFPPDGGARFTVLLPLFPEPPPMAADSVAGTATVEPGLIAQVAAG